MSSQQLDEEAIFHVARDIHVSDSRKRYLDQVGAGAQNLRSRVEALLDVHEQEQSFLKSSARESADSTIGQTELTASPGSNIGR